MTEKIKNEIKDRKNVFWVLIAGITLCLSLYGYFVGNTIFSVVERQQTEKAIGVAESAIQELETTYVDLKSHITVELAQNRGFKDITHTTYVSRVGDSKSLSFNR